MPRPGSGALVWFLDLWISVMLGVSPESSKLLVWLFKSYSPNFSLLCIFDSIPRSELVNGVWMRNISIGTNKRGNSGELE